MSAAKSYKRVLARHRKALKVKPVAQNEGLGKGAAIAAKNAALVELLKIKKVSNKLVREFEDLGIAELKEQLTKSRKELLDLRFKHAVGQLENVAFLPTTKRRIARILTLIKQKEVGA